MSKRIILSAMICTLSLGVVNTSLANELYVFPAMGQTNEETEFDKFTCYGWAKQQSGFDPMLIPKTETAAPSTQKKSGGAVTGALAGAALGAIVGDSSKSATRGALAGGLVGGVKQGSSNAKSEQKFNDWERQESSKYVHNRNSYNRAYTACLEGKGYTVK